MTNGPIEPRDRVGREKWKTIDDRWVVVDYDEQGCAHVTREVMHDLLVRAGATLNDREHFLSARP